jgi:hypothetical protein
MSYAAPSVGPTGLVINSYQDILDFYLDGATAIFGSAQYFGNSLTTSNPPSLRWAQGFRPSSP